LIKKQQLKEKFEKLQSEVAALAKAKSTADSKIVSVDSDHPSHLKEEMRGTRTLSIDDSTDHR
jgi:hypothetical protein